MSYCTVTHVQEEFKSVNFGATDASITTAKVTRFIEEADAEIDSKLGLVYETPITGTSSLIVVRSLSIAIVVDRIRAIVKTKTADPKPSQDTQREGSAEWARDYLEKLVEGKAKLLDATKLSSDDGVSSYVSSNNVEHKFKTDEDQW